MLIFTDEKLFKTVSDSKTELVNQKPNTAYEKKNGGPFGKDVVSKRRKTILGKLQKKVRNH